jgi:riboflavin kinase/FMN adenylyltransferase
MEVIVGIDNIEPPLKNTTVTIGNFDGVHLGHQALFRKVTGWAERLGGKSVVMTFDPHPLEILAPDKKPSTLTPHKDKLKLIASHGIDVTLIVPFSREFAAISAQDFVKKILVDRLDVKAVVVGHDYRFGRGRKGDIEFLRQMGEEYGFEVEAVSGISQEGTVVSSTLIRRLIRDGDLRRAGDLLGRPYEVEGTVVRGRDRGGRLLGFPTANIRMTDQARPKTGVYAVWAEVDGRRLPGAANLGWNPTFGDTEQSLEVHVLDFDGDLYGKPIRVLFVERLRGEKRFDGVDQLIAQIHADCARAREVLGVADRKASAC